MMMIQSLEARPFSTIGDTRNKAAGAIYGNEGGQGRSTMYQTFDSKSGSTTSEGTRLTTLGNGRSLALARDPLANLNKSTIDEISNHLTTDETAVGTKSRNQDARRPMTSATAGNRRSSIRKWGVEGYYVPDNDWMHERPHTFWSNSKKENILEFIARQKKEVPAPNLYQKLIDWNQNTSGKFFKSKRLTLIDQILETKKQKPVGPGTYDLPKFRIKGFVKQNTTKGEFIAEAKYIGQQTPGCKYKINYVRLPTF